MPSMIKAVSCAIEKWTSLQNHESLPWRWCRRCASRECCGRSSSVYSGWCRRCCKNQYPQVIWSYPRITLEEVRSGPKTPCRAEGRKLWGGDRNTSTTTQLSVFPSASRQKSVSTGRARSWAERPISSSPGSVVPRNTRCLLKLAVRRQSPVMRSHISYVIGPILCGSIKPLRIINMFLLWVFVKSVKCSLLVAN